MKLTCTISILAMVFFCCGQKSDRSSLNLKAFDTIINKSKNQVVIKSNSHDLDSLHLQQSVTTLLLDPKSDEEKKMVRGGDEKGLTFISGTNRDTIQIDSFSMNGQTLMVKIYYMTAPGRFYPGKVRLGSKNELILGYADKIQVDGYDFPPPYYSLEYSIHIPKDLKVERVIFLRD